MMLGGVAAAYIVDRGVLLVAVVSGTICLAAGFLAARRAPVDGGWVPRLERWWAGGSAADADAPAAHASRGPMAPLAQLAPAAAPAERGTAGVPQLQPSVVSTAPAAVPAARATAVPAPAARKSRRETPSEFCVCSLIVPSFFPDRAPRHEGQSGTTGLSHLRCHASRGYEGLASCNDGFSRCGRVACFRGESMARAGWFRVPTAWGKMLKTFEEKPS